MIEVRRVGAAHTEGDSFVCLQATRTAFAGEIVDVGGLPGVMGFSDSTAWLASFAAIAALDPLLLVPGRSA